MPDTTPPTAGGDARHDRTDRRLRVPRYLDACITGVMPTLLRTVGQAATTGGEPTTGSDETTGGEPTTRGDETSGQTGDRAEPGYGRLAGQLRDVTGVVLVVLDGLGAQLLRDHA